MTYPVELRVTESVRTGTPFAAYRIGERVGPLEFELEPGFVDEYLKTTGLDASLYRYGERDLAPPQVLSLFLMPTLHRRYPPLPGTVMSSLDFEVVAPIWRDEPTRIVASGLILDKFERRERRFIRWIATYSRESGGVLARITNTFAVPG